MKKETRKIEKFTLNQKQLDYHDQKLMKSPSIKKLMEELSKT